MPIDEFGQSYLNILTVIAEPIMVRNGEYYWDIKINTTHGLVLVARKLESEQAQEFRNKLSNWIKTFTLNEIEWKAIKDTE